MTEGDAAEDLAILARHRSACRNDVQHPLDRNGHRRVAQLRVACLVAEARRNAKGADRRRRRHANDRTNRELPLEYGERLCLSGLLQIGGRGIDDFGDDTASRRLDREDGRNERRLARGVRLDVEAFGKRHAQCQPCGVSGVHAVARGNRGQLGRRTPGLRVTGCGGQHQRAERKQDDGGNPCWHGVQSIRAALRAAPPRHSIRIPTTPARAASFPGARAILMTPRATQRKPGDRGVYSRRMMPAGMLKNRSFSAHWQVHNRRVPELHCSFCPHSAFRVRFSASGYSRDATSTARPIATTSSASATARSGSLRSTVRWRRTV